MNIVDVFFNEMQILKNDSNNNKKNIEKNELKNLYR